MDLSDLSICVISSGVATNCGPCKNVEGLP